MSNNDLMEADCWSHMVNFIDETDETLEHRFYDFSLRADKWLLGVWKESLETNLRRNPNDADKYIVRFEEIIGILERVIAKKENEN